MTITKGESAYLKLAFENGKPTPARYTKTLKSSWDFVPDAERKQTISMYPIMVTGAMGLNMKHYLDEKIRHKKLLAKAHRILARNKMSQVVTSDDELAPDGGGQYRYPNQYIDDNDSYEEEK